jgi:hypothetical protein
MYGRFKALVFIIIENGIGHFLRRVEDLQQGSPAEMVLLLTGVSRDQSISHSGTDLLPG